MVDVYMYMLIFFFEQKTAYEMRISDWSSDVCSSDLQRLGSAGFTLEPMRIEDVDNFWASHGKHDGPVLCFAGHTDVVPTGPVQAWQLDPFDAVIDEHGMLCGRGAADMKGSLAAMVVAAERFVADYPDQDLKSTRLNSSH